MGRREVGGAIVHWLTRTALREAKECKGAVAVAQRWGYVGENAAVVDRMDKIVATLVRLTKPRS